MITAVVIEGRPVAEVAAAYRVSRSWIYELLARHRVEGDAAFEPRSKTPVRSPNALGDTVIELIVATRREVVARGLDAGAAEVRPL